MKRLLLLALSLVSFSAFGQSVPGTINLTWTLPTTGVTNLPLTGTQALTEQRLYISTSPIPANFAGAPTQTLLPGIVAATQSMQVTNGATIYARLQACNKPAAVTECSVMTTEVSKLVSIDTRPNPQTGVVINLTITP